MSTPPHADQRPPAPTGPPRRRRKQLTDAQKAVTLIAAVGVFVAFALYAWVSVDMDGIDCGAPMDTVKRAGLRSVVARACEEKVSDRSQLAGGIAVGSIIFGIAGREYLKPDPEPTE